MNIFTIDKTSSVEYEIWSMMQKADWWVGPDVTKKKKKSKKKKKKKK